MSVARPPVSAVDRLGGVLAWLFSIQPIITGVLQLVSASSDVSGVSGRVLSCVLGTLSILVGLLCLRTPLQTALVLGLPIGIAWVIGGVIRIVQGIAAALGAARGWWITGGVLWVIAGGLVLAYPGASLVALASVLGIVLILEGTCLIAVGFTTRRPDPARRRRSTSWGTEGRRQPPCVGWNRPGAPASRYGCES
jgi:uncharacterized membrane protein HdeD (DUF308 family)